MNKGNRSLTAKQLGIDPKTVFRKLKQAEAEAEESAATPTSPPLLTVAYEQIRYEAADGIATVTLWRPEKLNAVTSVMIGELVAAFDARMPTMRCTWSSSRVRARVLRGRRSSGGAQTFDGATRGRHEPDGEHATAAGSSRCGSST